MQGERRQEVQRPDPERVHVSLSSLDFGDEEPVNNCKWKEACCGGKRVGWSR